MHGKRWSIPYIDQPLDFWRMIRDTFGPAIACVYFPFPDSELGSGRPTLPNRYLKAFLSSGILDLSLVANPLVLTRPLREIEGLLLHSIGNLYKEYGLREIVVANIELAKIIRDTFPDMRIVASVLMDICSNIQLVYLESNCDVLVPSSRIMRDMRALESIKTSFPGRTRILVNEMCLPGCLVRAQHGFEIAMSVCTIPYCQRLSPNLEWMRLLGAWVQPEHLHFYDHVADEYKLACRLNLRDTSDYYHVLSAYINRRPIPYKKIKSYRTADFFRQANVTEAFLRKTLYCNKQCTTCRYCKTFYKQNFKEICSKR